MKELYIAKLNDYKKELESLTITIEKDIKDLEQKTFKAAGLELLIKTIKKEIKKF